MNLRPTGLSGWRVRHWVAAIGAALLVTLTPLSYIQYKQFDLMQDVAVNQVDSIMWQSYQLERELSHLGYALHSSVDPESTVEMDHLVERYEVFVSRIALVTDMPRSDLLNTTPAYLEAIRLVNDFVTQADPVFADPDALLAQRPARLALTRAIEQIGPAMGELTREANRATARFVDERNIQLRDQGRLVIGLAGIQALVLLLFVVLLVRHLRRQVLQYEKLQAISRELAVARDEAEAANHGKSVFLANMSHEIRTPFQGVLGMLNLLDETRLSSQQRDYVQTARDSAQHLLSVLNDILDVSTMESGTLRLAPEPSRLRSLVQEVEGLMRAAAREKGLTLEVETAPDLPEWVMADPTRVRQILFNLLGNAVKFTSEGSITARLSRLEGTPDGVSLTVQDTGMGMDAATVAQLFTRFYQADNSIRRRIGGSGLGLEISRNLAHMMGGNIEVCSEPGQGSVFTVHMILPQTVAPALVAHTTDGTGPARQLRVLVAEDHPINLKYMNILLERMGHEAVFCENGQEALQLLASQPFDVVLLDYHMPVLDGLATTAAIRALDSPNKDIKVVLVTADVVNDTRKKALDVGVNEFASKPLQAQDLRRALQRCGLLDATTVLVGDAAPVPEPLAPRAQDLDASAAGLIDTESYTEIVAMMPPDTMDELLGTLFEPPEGSVHVLLASLAAGDAAQIAYDAHKLKGTAMLLGFRALVRTSAQIERLAQEEDMPLRPELGTQLLDDASRTQQALREFSGELPV
ncbi:MAG: ATP-binding protein [Hydrogenophaga sp.]|uniref:ATP-binding protein n=1 Tax=Hydrogenophaga sp. TaxID=1904254 RepID=UPI0026395FFC|nr:ATP-binding protein [Hydrogenophaga sp.]MDM7944210.1 ATP-binding protein [Hydrogenophaga sp.]